jgi:membrane protein
VFPLLVLLMGLLRYIGLEVENLTELLHGILPTALMPSAQKLILNTYRSTTGTLVSISALTALWSAGRGIYGLITGLNSVYSAEENRGYFHTRLVSMLYTVGFLAVLLLTLVLHVFGTGLLEWLPVGGGLERILESVLDLRFFLLLILQMK